MDTIKNDIECRVLQPFDSGLNFWAPSLYKQLKQWQPTAVLCMGRMANAFVKSIKQHLPDCTVFATVRTGKALPWHNARSLHHADGIIVNSAWWANELKRFDVSPARVKTIYNSLTREWDVSQLPNLRECIRKKYNIPESTCVFVNIAGMRPGKRHDWLIERFAEYSSAHDQLWIVGDGVQAQHCKSLADRLGLEGRIKFSGFVADPLAWLAGADVAVSASIEDAQPNFLVEAQSVGLPCIAVDFRGVAECFLNHSSGLLLNPNDESGFVNALQNLSRNLSTRKHMSEQAIIYAKENFDAHTNGDAYLDYFMTFITTP